MGTKRKGGKQSGAVMLPFKETLIGTAPFKFLRSSHPQLPVKLDSGTITRTQLLVGIYYPEGF